MSPTYSLNFKTTNQKVNTTRNSHTSKEYFNTIVTYCLFQSCELVATTTWVIADHVNSPGCPGDLSVTRGQQVEVLDIPSPSTALVRIVPPNSNPSAYSTPATNSAFAKSTTSPSSTAGGVSDQTTNNQLTSNEGTVPISCLKQPPGGFRSQNDISGNIWINAKLV